MFLVLQKRPYYKYNIFFSIFRMTESQSRYSIVERLTQKKLDIISENLELDDEVKRKEQRVEQLKKETEDWENEIQQETEKTRRLKQREIEKSEISRDNAVERKTAKGEALKEKIKAIERALERIEEISKTSPTNQ